MTREGGGTIWAGHPTNRFAPAIGGEAAEVSKVGDGDRTVAVARRPWRTTPRQPWVSRTPAPEDGSGGSGVSLNYAVGVAEDSKRGGQPTSPGSRGRARTL